MIFAQQKSKQAKKKKNKKLPSQLLICDPNYLLMISNSYTMKWIKTVIVVLLRNNKGSFCNLYTPLKLTIMCTWEDNYTSNQQVGIKLLSSNFSGAFKLSLNFAHVAIKHLLSHLHSWKMFFPEIYNLVTSYYRDNKRWSFIKFINLSLLCSALCKPQEMKFWTS